MAAIHASLMAVLQAGDRVVATRAIYGSTRSLLTQRFGRLGVDVAFVDATDLAAVEAALTTAPTRVLYVETISNPTIVVVDVAALAELAHRHGALLIVDNTFASPMLCRPVELGADLVIESLTKYIGGHSDTLGGSVAGSRERIAAVKAVEIDTGATLAPFAAFLVLRGIATLAVRMTRHAATARGLADWLEAQPGIARVYHPDLPSHPQHAVAAAPVPARQRDARLRARRGAGRGAGGGRRVHRRPDDPGADGLAREHPHDRRPSADDHPPPIRRGPARGGRHPAGLLRCSVGLEDLDDLIADFDQALAIARAVAGAGTPRAREPRLGRRRRRLGDVIATIAADRAVARGRPDPVSRLGRSIWGLLTSVNFAVAQIIVLVVMGAVGMTIRQLPSFAFRTPADYSLAMADIHARYDPQIGAAGVGAARTGPGVPGLQLVVVQRHARGADDLDRRAARSTGRRGCGVSRATSGSSSRIRTSTRPCPTGPGSTA